MERDSGHIPEMTMGNLNINWLQVHIATIDPSYCWRLGTQDAKT